MVLAVAGQLLVGGVERGGEGEHAILAQEVEFETGPAEPFPWRVVRHRDL